ncbi:MAG: glycosyltransferase [Acidobacteria bacterium]|nr:glycosyltransferase [Acidobacteriota bacterium]
MTEKTQPTLTIITPTYNQADFLRDTIESVLSQDYPKHRIPCSG